MSKHISIVGIGMGNPDLLTREVRCALIEAELVIGAKRMKDALPKNCQAQYMDLTDGREILSGIDKTEAESSSVWLGTADFTAGQRDWRPCWRKNIK